MYCVCIMYNVILVIAYTSGASFVYFSFRKALEQSEADLSAVFFT